MSGNDQDEQISEQMPITPSPDYEVWVREPPDVSPAKFAVVACLWGAVCLAFAAATPFLWRAVGESATTRGAVLLILVMLGALVIGGLDVAAAVIALRIKGAFDRVPPSSGARGYALGHWTSLFQIAAYPLRYLVARRESPAASVSSGNDAPIYASLKKAVSLTVTTRAHNRAVLGALISGTALVLSGLVALAVERAASIGVFGAPTQSPSDGLVGIVVMCVPVALGAVLLGAGLVAHFRGLEGEGYIRRSEFERRERLKRLAKNPE